jgi:hypothetical protein
MEKRGTYKSAIMNETIDERTGEVIRQAVVTEVIPGYIDVKVPKKGRFNNGDFITIFQNTMYRIATEAKLSKNELVLLLYLLGTAGIDNSICTDLQILSEELQIDKGNISRSIKGLVKRNIVIRKDGYRGGEQRTLPMELSLNYDQLNYDLSYKGKVKDYSKFKGIHPEIEPNPQLPAKKEPDLFDLIAAAEAEQDQDK